MEKLARCKPAIASDISTFGIDCIQRLLDVTEVIVKYKTEQQRLKQDALATFNKRADGISTERANADILVLVNATLLTMHHGKEQRDLIEGGVIVVRAGVFESVGSAKEVRIPDGATVINAHGGQSS